MNTGVPGQDFPGSDLGMPVQVLENRHGRETIHSMGAGFTLVFVKLATFGTGTLSCFDHRSVINERRIDLIILKYGLAS
jgi:hypothetical protein